MKCLMKYPWVKLPRNRVPAGNGNMGAWMRLAARAAFRKGEGRYCGFDGIVVSAVATLALAEGCSGRQAHPDAHEPFACRDPGPGKLDPGIFYETFHCGIASFLGIWYNTS